MDYIPFSIPKPLVQILKSKIGVFSISADPKYICFSFQLLFDEHHIIFAEGIAAESFLHDLRTAPALPQDLARELVGKVDAAPAPHGHDVHENLLKRPDAADLLRRASTR